jgi:LysM repeat protein
MSPKRRFVTLALLALLLAGCFRQASDSYEENTGTTAGQPPPGQEVPLQTLPQSESTPTVPVLRAFTATPSIPQPGSQPQPIDPQAEQTETIEESSSTSGGSAATTLQPITTSAAVTPGLPSGPVVPNTPAPTLDMGLLILTNTPSGLITPTNLAGGNTGDCVYIVVTNDTLFGIARANGTTVAELRAANPELAGDLINPGDELALPNCVEGQGVVSGTAAPTPAVGTPRPAGTTIHVVVAGDTLTTIAQQYGVTVQAIVAANNLENPNRLDVGQELVIPTGG